MFRSVPLWSVRFRSVVLLSILLRNCVPLLSCVALSSLVLFVKALRITFAFSSVRFGSVSFRCVASCCIVLLCYTCYAGSCGVVFVCVALLLVTALGSCFQFSSIRFHSVSLRVVAYCVKLLW